MWLYNTTPFQADQIEDSYGFVYLIENTVTGRKYIGRKYFTSAGTKQVKGKKKRIRKQSDWEGYWSSSEEVKKDIQQYGKEKFTRTILHLCKTRASCSYFETYEIFTRDALLSTDFYNSWVSCKIHAAHVKGIIWRENNQLIQQSRSKKGRINP